MLYQEGHHQLKPLSSETMRKAGRPPKLENNGRPNRGQKNERKEQKPGRMLLVVKPKDLGKGNPLLTSRKLQSKLQIGHEQLATSFSTICMTCRGCIV